jgi:ubiquinone/menaquinone biosynthesis C-methylase UbiE
MSSGFDRLASLYGVLEHFLFASRLQEMRLMYLSQLADCQDILLIGEGTGLFLEKLLRVNPKAKVTVIDQSAKMIKRARGRVAEHDLHRVTFQTVAFENFLSANQFDALCTFFFWDCFEKDRIREMLPLLRSCMKREGLWFEVDFFEDQRGARPSRIWHYFLLRFLYGFFGWATGIEARWVEEIEPLAKENGFSLTHSQWADRLPVRARIFQNGNGMQTSRA